MMRLTINLVLFMGIACAGASSAGLIETGVWGGEHVRLTVRASGADIEFDCAHGRVEEPIILDDAKHFDARGVFVRERGGPVREGEVEDAKPARYQGTVKGDAMILTVTLESGDDLGLFSLTRGSSGRLVKCLQSFASLRMDLPISSAWPR